MDAEIAAKTRALAALDAGLSGTGTDAGAGSRLLPAPSSLASLSALPALSTLVWSDPPDGVTAATSSRDVAAPARTATTGPAAVDVAVSPAGPGPAAAAGGLAGGADNGGEPTPIVLLLSNRVEYATRTVQALAASVADAKRAGLAAGGKPGRIACVIVFLIPGRFEGSRGAVEAALPGWLATMGAACDTTAAIDGSTLHQCPDPGANLKLNIWMRCASLSGSLSPPS